MAKVFISHASSDSAVAGSLHRWLVEVGHDVFVDIDRTAGLTLGEAWEDRLYDRLRWADGMVCLVTAEYIASTWCFGEIASAKTLGKRILPLSVEPGLIHPLIEGVQHTNYSADETVHPDLAAALREMDAAGGWAWPEGRSPYPGLRAFATDMGQVFFGRRAEISDLAATLRSPAHRAAKEVVVVVGPSGCGKSSLVRAGLVPLMEREASWCVLAPIVPGEDPVAALAREIATHARLLGIPWTLGEVRTRLDGDAGLADLAEELIVASSTAERRPSRLLIVIDQLEELITLASSSSRARLAALLRPAMAGPVAVMATVRPEYLDPLLTGAELAGVSMRLFPLRPLRRDAIAAVIEEPARLAGLTIDDGLVARLVADTGSGDALPLLAYALGQLTEGVDRGGRISEERYNQMGGVVGALARQADAALAAAIRAGGRNEGQVLTGLLRLVTLDEQGQPSRRRVDQSQLPPTLRDELAAFVDHRLVTAESEGNAIVLSVAHEAFLTSWPPFAKAIRADEAALRRRRDIEQAAKDWAAAGRPSSRLWERGHLAAALDDLGGVAATSANAVDRVDLSTPAREFLRLSLRRDRFKRRRLSLVASALAIVFFFLAAGAGVAAVVALRQGNTARENQRIAVVRQLVATANTMQQTDPALALRLGLAAQVLHPDHDTRSGLVSSLLATPYAGSFASDAGELYSVAFSPDGRTVATGGIDGKVSLWNIDTDGPPEPLGEPVQAHPGWTRTVFSPAGGILATVGQDKDLVLWDVTDPAKPAIKGRATDAAAGGTFLDGLAFSADGTMVAVGGENGSLTLWDAKEPASPRRLGEPVVVKDSVLRSISFTPDGHTLITGGDPGSCHRMGYPGPRNT